MFKKYLLSIYIAFMAFNAHGFETSATYAFLLDADTNTVLYQKAPDELMSPSSMTKLMTTYIVFERLKEGIFTLEDTFPVSEKAWKKGGSKMFVRVGNRVSIKDLLMGVIVQSGNDACIVLAEGIASSEEEFAELMNQTAKRMGLKNSFFKNSTGWPDEEHVMTVRDLAILSKRLIEDFPDLYKMFAQKSFTFSDIKQNNRNSLLNRDIGVDGLKTGYTSAAGYGIAVSAEREGRRLISVVNGLDSHNQRINESEKLLNYGYRYFENKVVLTKGKVVAEADVWLGTKPTISLVAKEDIAMIVPKIPSKDIDVKVVYQSPVLAPVEQGTELATLHIAIPNMEAQQFSLYAGETVEKAGIVKRLMKKLSDSLEE